MAKLAPSNTLDAMLDYVAGSTTMAVCSGGSEPTTRAAAVAAALATVTMAGGDFTKAAGTGTGARQTTVAAKSGVSVTATGTATHIALYDGTVLRYVTTCTSQGLTSGNTVNIPAWVINMTQPT